MICDIKIGQGGEHEEYVMLDINPLAFSRPREVRAFKNI